MHDVTGARDDARRALIAALDSALELHEQRHGEAQWRQKKRDEAALLQLAELTIADRLRLERLQYQLLPTLDSWMALISGVKEELEELVGVNDLIANHLKGMLDGMNAQHKEWEAMIEELDNATLRDKQAARRRASAPEAADQAKGAVHKAKIAVQLAESGRMLPA